MAEYTRPLILSSPHETGKRVSHAQRVLSVENHFKQNFHPGLVDGEMGEQTAGAIHRAKWFLGYPKNRVDSTMGVILYRYLTGTNKLPLTYAIRRKSRMVQIAKINTNKVRAVEMALADAAIPVKESPAGSNKQKYGEWFGWNGVFWCGQAISYWLAHTGNKNFYPGFSASCSQIEQAAREGSHHLAITSHPEKGDLAIYNHDEHIEIFEKWLEDGVTFQAVGGNTSASDGSYNNGGEVATNKRWVADAGFPVTCWIRVGI